MKYRKKPIVIEAEQLNSGNIFVLEKWCGGSIRGTALPIINRCIDIETLEGEMRAEMGDWIIKGVKGEFYPIKNEIFIETYDKLEP